MKMKKYFRNRNFLIGSIMVGLLIALCLVSLVYTPYDANLMDTNLRFLTPGIHHPFGTDNFGRDILSRIMKGSQVAFLIGIFSVLIGLLIGLIIGSVSGYFGGVIDEIFMRIIDAKMAFPGVLLALMLISIYGTGLWNTIIALGIMSIPRFARITRSGYIQYKEFEFVKAARVRGASNFRIMYIHILPNLISPLIVTCSMGFAGAVMSEAGLSYLGLGIQPPDPSWGKMLNEAQGYLLNNPWYALAPGILITIMVLGFNLLGDGIRDVNDVKDGR